MPQFSSTTPLVPHQSQGTFGLCPGPLQLEGPQILWSKCIIVFGNAVHVPQIYLSSLPPTDETSLIAKQEYNHSLSLISTLNDFASTEVAIEMKIVSKRISIFFAWFPIFTRPALFLPNHHLFSHSMGMYVKLKFFSIKFSFKICTYCMVLATSKFEPLLICAQLLDLPK